MNPEPKDCIVYNTKYLKLEDVTVAIIDARYGFFLGGVKGYITIRNLNNNEKSFLSVLSEFVIPSGTIEQMKTLIDTFFDKITIQDL